MEEVFDVAVIGAGMFGSAAAKYLSRAGARTIVLGPVEPPPGVGVDHRALGAYFDEARITRRLGWDEVWGATDSTSLARFRDIEAESGIAFFHECGSLVVMANTIRKRTDTILERCAVQCIAVERLCAESLRSNLPFLGLPPMKGGVEGLYERSMAGYLNPRQFVRAQLELAVQGGAILQRKAVTALRKDPDSVLWRLTVEADDGPREIVAERVLVATGAFTNHSGLLPADCRLALHAFTEPNLLFELRPDQVDELSGMPAVVTVDPEDTGNDNMSIYLLPPIRYPDGAWYVRIGPGMQPIVHELDTVDAMTAWYSRQEVASEQAEFLERMRGLLLADLLPVSVRHACCIVEKTPSRYPFIGALGASAGLFVAVGGNGHGARGSDEIGRLAASVVLGDAWDSPIDRDTFEPILAGAKTPPRERPEFLKPPFGLC